MFNNLIGKNKELGRFLFCERYTLPPVKNAMYIAEGQELKKGAVVDVNGYLIGTAGLQPYAVLEFDCDTREGGKEASVFLMGEFNYDKLTFADGLSKDDMDNIVYNARKVGIVIKPYSFSLGFVPQAEDEPENFEKAKKYAKVGDAIYADSLGNVHVIEGKLVKASTIPEGWEFVGVVALREGTKATILYKTEKSNTKFARMWLFKLSGLKLNGTDTMVLQQGPASGSTPVEVGTFTASAAATDLDTLVSELDTWLRTNTTATGAFANYNWHAEKHEDADGVESCFIVVDNINTQSRFNPVKSSTSGATASLYMWNFAQELVNASVIKRKDGVDTVNVVYNKERFKAYNTSVGSPVDSLTTTGLFNEAGFNATTLVKGYYGTYDNYLDNMAPDEDATTGAYALFKGKGKEISQELSSVVFKDVSGTDTDTFELYSYVATFTAHSLASVEGLNAGDFFVPSTDVAYKIFREMKTDGSDLINSAFVNAGSSSFSLERSRWITARSFENVTWKINNAGFFANYDLFSTTNFAFGVASYDVGE